MMKGAHTLPAFAFGRNEFLCYSCRTSNGVLRNMAKHSKITKSHFQSGEADSNSAGGTSVHQVASVNPWPGSIPEM